MGVVGGLKVTCRITRFTPSEGVVSPVLKTTMQIMSSGPGSGDGGSQPSTHSPLMDICSASGATGQIRPSTS